MAARRSGVISSPWLVFNQGENDKYTTQTFFNVAENRYYEAKVPKLRDKQIHTCSHGWLVLTDVNSEDCFLLNPVSMEKIVLPPLDHVPSYTTCILSSPPTDPNCFVIFMSSCSSKKPRFRFSRLGDIEWTQQELKSESEKKVRGMVVCGGKIYGISPECTLLTVDVVGSNIVVTQLPGVEKRPTPSFPETSIMEPVLVESRGELFLVIKSFLGNTMKTRNIDIYKMDFSTMEWEKVESLGDRAFFLDPDAGYSCPAPAKSGIKQNSIYFVESEDTDLYVFDIENHSISTSEPCPVRKDWLQPNWVMPVV